MVVAVRTFLVMRVYFPRVWRRFKHSILGMFVHPIPLSECLYILTDENQIYNVHHEQTSFAEQEGAVCWLGF